jgi:hypothetical protein
MKNIKIPEEYFRFYLNKHHKDQNIYFLLKNSKIIHEFVNKNIPLHYINSIVECLEAGISIKKIKKFLKQIKEHNFPAIILLDVGQSKKILIQENQSIIEPNTKQYYLNFYQNTENKTIHLYKDSKILKFNDIYKVILKYKQKGNLEKIYDYCNYVFNVQKYNNIFSVDELQNLYEIFSNVVLTIKKPKEAYRIFKLFYRDLNEPFFLKQMAIILFLCKHYQISLNFFSKYYNLIRHNKLEQNKIQNMMQIIESIMLIKNKQKLKLLKKES